jgi:hypothetical protein
MSSSTADTANITNTTKGIGLDLRASGLRKK